MLRGLLPNCSQVRGMCEMTLFKVSEFMDKPQMIRAKLMERLVERARQASNVQSIETELASCTQNQTFATHLRQRHRVLIRLLCVVA